MTFKGSETDRLAIRELLDSCSHAVMRRDAEGFAAIWHDDGVWEFQGARIEGRAAIVETWVTAMADIEAIAINMFPGSIIVDGDAATVFTHTFEHVQMKGANAFFIAGTYEDRLTRRPNGGWGFSQRIFTPRPLANPS